MRCLVIEDDKQLREYIAQGLREAGHSVDTAEDGKRGLFLATTEDYDVLVIDWMLPGADGISILHALRASDNSVPALMLSARSEVDDRVRGLRSGADDYLVKPFAFEELLARVEVLTARRGGSESAETTSLDCHDLHMDLLRRRVTRAGQSIELNPREFSLLEYLMRHADQVVTRTMLLEKVWDYHFDPQTNVIDVHISRLRQKIDKGHDRALIHTVRGAGYRLSPEQ
ncbi:MAG: response regulator transcription factor [Pseudomonadota bacterium]